MGTNNSNANTNSSTSWNGMIMNKLRFSVADRGFPLVLATALKLYAEVTTSSRKKKKSQQQPLEGQMHRNEYTLARCDDQSRPWIRLQQQKQQQPQSQQLLLRSANKKTLTRPENDDDSSIDLFALGDVCCAYTLEQWQWLLCHLEPSMISRVMMEQQHQRQQQNRQQGKEVHKSSLQQHEQNKKKQGMEVHESSRQQPQQQLHKSQDCWPFRPMPPMMRFNWKTGRRERIFRLRTRIKNSHSSSTQKKESHDHKEEEGVDGDGACGFAYRFESDMDGMPRSEKGRWAFLKENSAFYVLLLLCPQLVVGLYHYHESQGHFVDVELDHVYHEKHGPCLFLHSQQRQGNHRPTTATAATAHPPALLLLEGPFGMRFPATLVCCLYQYIVHEYYFKKSAEFLLAATVTHRNCAYANNDDNENGFPVQNASCACLRHCTMERAQEHHHRGGCIGYVQISDDGASAAASTTDMYRICGHRPCCVCIRRLDKRHVERGAPSPTVVIAAAGSGGDNSNYKERNNCQSSRRSSRSIFVQATQSPTRPTVGVDEARADAEHLRESSSVREPPPSPVVVPPPPRPQPPPGSRASSSVESGESAFTVWRDTNCSDIVFIPLPSDVDERRLGGLAGIAPLLGDGSTTTLPSPGSSIFSCAKSPPPLKSSILHVSTPTGMATAFESEAVVDPAHAATEAPLQQEQLMNKAATAIRSSTDVSVVHRMSDIIPATIVIEKHHPTQHRIPDDIPVMIAVHKKWSVLHGRTPSCSTRGKSRGIDYDSTEPAEKPPRETAVSPILCVHDMNSPKYPPAHLKSHHTASDDKSSRHHPLPPLHLSCSHPVRQHNCGSVGRLACSLPRRPSSMHPSRLDGVHAPPGEAASPGHIT